MGVLSLDNVNSVRNFSRDIYSVNFADYLPEALKRDPKVNALAVSMTEQLLEVSKNIDHVLIYARIDELPEELVDILAFDMHVDWYDYSYPLEVKRKILKSSVSVHKKMGTIYAIQTALGSLYPEVKVIEWFAYNGKPYTFRVEINVTDFYETVENKNRIIKIINMYKRLSAHLEFIIYRVVVWLKIEIKYNAAITYMSMFYPRYNISSLFLDSESKLDGNYMLNGYKGSECIDFYPIHLLIYGDIISKINYFEQMRCFLKVALSLKEADEMRIRSDFYPRCNLPLFRLDGTQFLNGKHTLNEMDQDFESLFLDGSGCLDGVYIINGYMDSHNFDFYPLKMDIKGECEQKSVISGSSYSNTNAEIQTESNSFLSSKGICVEKSKIKESCSVKGEIGEVHTLIEERLTVEKDLYFLNGEQGLDGTVFLDADIYEVKI